MTQSRLCPICGQVIKGRSDKKHCSAECKKVSKQLYDQIRYKELAPQIIANVRKHYLADKSRKQVYDRQYRIKHKEKIAQAKANYARMQRILYPEKVALDGVTRSAGRRAITRGKVSAKDLKHLLNRFQNKCAYCNEDIRVGYEFDHVIPVSRGGQHAIGNLLPSCRTCNWAKSHKFIMEYRLNKFVPYSKTRSRREEN